jgi:Domain of unknown function (DUF4336)
MNAILEHLDDNLWVARRPLPLIVGDIGARMTVIRLQLNKLFIHSPVALDCATKEALDALGTVTWVVGPNDHHHFYLQDFAKAYPDAVLCGAIGLPRKKNALRFDHVFDGTGDDLWGEELESHLFDGAKPLHEVIFFHPSSRTLLLTDLAFNVTATGVNKARIFHRLVGATGRFGPHRIVRTAIRDKAAARRSVDRILEWDFERVIVSHGEVIEEDGRARFAQAFAFLPLAR